MNARELVSRYYELANAGEWDSWCDLFSLSAVVDEQLAGRVEGRETLREMMKGFPDWPKWVGPHRGPGRCGEGAYG